MSEKRPLEIALMYVKSYWTWKGMIRRVTNPRYNRWETYGGRGIKVCEAWRDYDNFFRDMGLPPSLDHSLDRIDNDGHYEPANCRWATTQEQGVNKRNTLWLEYKGERLPLTSWARRLGMDARVIRTRIYQERWSVERALTTPTLTQWRRGRKKKVVA